MKFKLIITLLFINSIFVIAQKANYKTIDPETQFEGGQQAYWDLLLNNVSYPPEARENQRQGKVVLAYTLTKDGKITNVVIKNSVGLGCDEESITLLKLMEGKLKNITKDDESYEFFMNFTIKDDKIKSVPDLTKEADKLITKEKYAKSLTILDEIIRRTPYDLAMLQKRAISRAKTNDKNGACLDWTRIKELNQTVTDVYLEEICK